MNEPEGDKLNAEWAALSAVRELMRLATRDQQATYDQALELGAVLVPELLDEDVSLIKQARESDTAREYRQLAKAQSLADDIEIDPLTLIRQDIDKYRKASQTKGNDAGTDRIRRRLKLIESAEVELDPTKHSENQLIFRDAYNVDRGLPTVNIGQGHKDLELPDGNVLRVRVLHPERPEHISGADMIYERHQIAAKRASIVAVQYKIWDDKVMYLSDERMQKQLTKMKQFACDTGLCSAGADDHDYRFPFCAAFLRPTDKLQSPDQRLKSTGEHLPICRIKACTGEGVNGAEVLKYDNIREVSLSHHVFEELFSRGKIGSRSLTYDALADIYAKFGLTDVKDRVILHAQEYAPQR